MASHRWLIPHLRHIVVIHGLQGQLMLGLLLAQHLEEFYGAFACGLIEQLVVERQGVLLALHGQPKNFGEIHTRLVLHIHEIVAALDILDPLEFVAGDAFVQALFLEFLEQNGVPVITGVCEAQAKKLNEFFIKYVGTGRPFVIAKCAATLDGRIATRTGDSRWVTGEAARRFVHQLRHKVDAIMVGINTIRNDDPSLTTRLPGLQGSDPTRVILDTHLTISPDARVLQQASAAPTILVAGIHVAGNKKTAIEKAGARVLKVALKNDLIDMNLLMQQLGAMELTSLLIEGGSRVLASAFNHAVVDKVFFFYAPKILGGDDGVPICSGPSAEYMDECIGIRDIAVHRLGDDVLIEGYVEAG